MKIKMKNTQLKPPIKPDSHTLPAPSGWLTELMVSGLGGAPGGTRTSAFGRKWTAAKYC